MSFNKQRRFLAGAVCPRCAAQDKIQVYSKDEKDIRECVACGFKQQMSFQSAPRELGTRVNQAEESAETQVLQFPPPSEKKE